MDVTSASNPPNNFPGLPSAPNQTETVLIDPVTGEPLGMGAYNTNLADYPDEVPFTISGADDDTIIAGEAGKQHFVFEGWFQTDIDVTVTFKSGATALGKPIKMKALETYGIFMVLGQFAPLRSVAGQGISMTKDTNATINGVLWKETVEVTA